VLKSEGVPSFYAAFYIMSAICLLFNGAMAIASIRLLRDGGSIWLFIGLSFGQVVYGMVLAQLWLMQVVGKGWIVATLAANTGLSWQLYTLFPIWAPMVLMLRETALMRAIISERSAQDR